jgi:glycosyltransferase involved in cell wall biosynthesis
MEQIREVSIVVPVYKNEETLDELNHRIFSVLSENFESKSNFEIIYVVDGSPDNSFQVLQSLQLSSKKLSLQVRIIELSANYGQTAAIIAGIEHSDALAQIVISADLQDPPEAITGLIKAWQEGFDIVISTRASRDDTWFEMFTSRVAHTIFRFSQPEMPIHGFDFFLLSREAAKNLINLRGKSRFLQGDVLSLGFKRKLVSHERVHRKHGKSSYNFRSRLKLFIDSLFENSKFPMTAIFALGTLISVMGIILASLSIVSYLLGAAPFSGFVAIFSSILFLGGIQIFLIGLVGQFVFRSFEIARGRPLYIVRQILQ